MKKMPTSVPRDYRIDFFRGLALISIFVNHIPGNFYASFTHRNFGLSDAAEIFVLLAGISSAFAYFPRFVRGEAPLAVGLVAKRIGTLYLAHLSAMIVGFAIYAVAALWFDDVALMQADERHWILDEPVKSLAGIGLLTYQTGNFNILPMYMGMMALLPLIMLLARRSLALALGASFALWLGVNVWQFNLPNFPGNGGWFFNPLAWQLLFTIGFCCGVVLRRGERLAFSPRLYAAAVAYLLAAIVLVKADLWRFFPALPEWFWITGFGKTWIGVFRLSHVLALGYVVAMSPLPAFLARRLDESNWLVSLGRNTLPVFWMGTMLSVVGHILRERLFGLPNDPTYTGPGFLVDTVMIGAGILLLLLLAVFLDWTKAAGKRRLASAAPDAAAAAVPAK